MQLTQTVMVESQRRSTLEGIELEQLQSNTDDAMSKTWIAIAQRRFY